MFRNILLGALVLAASAGIGGIAALLSGGSAVATPLSVGLAVGIALAYGRKWYHLLLRSLEAQTEHLRGAAILSSYLGGMPVYWSQHAFAPESLFLLLHIMQSQRPRRVLELGSGVSTLFIAKFLMDQGEGTVDSYDHDPRWTAMANQSLHQRDLRTCAEVRLAPLTPILIGSQHFHWYELPKAGSCEAYDLIVVDGPPTSAQNPLARLPALYLLRQHMHEKSVLILDDTNREWEAEVSARWERDFPELTFRKVPIGRGLLIVSGSAEVFNLLPYLPPPRIWD